MVAGDTELWRFRPGDDPSPNSLRRVSNIWLAGADDGSTMLFDWIDVTGTESGADMSDGEGAARRLDLARAALEASARNPIRRGSPAGTRRNRNER